MKLEEIAKQARTIYELMESVEKKHKPYGNYLHVAPNAACNIGALLESGGDKIIPIKKLVDALRNYLRLIGTDKDFAEMECRKEGYPNIPNTGGGEEGALRHKLNGKDKRLYLELGGAGYYMVKAVERFRESKK